MHHKRKRPKNRRAGCLMCKPHKVNGASPRMKFKPSELRRLQDSVDPPLDAP
jgi:hypothetical protein